MTMKTRSAIGATILAAAALALAAPARADAGVKVGVLACSVSSGWGFIFGSSRGLKCSFTHEGMLERYAGHIRKFGVDIGYQSGGIIVWGVFAPAADIGKGALAGDYGGASGSAAVGIGAGANVLIGGFKQSITLQPLSIEGTSGLNVAAGIAEVTLEYRP
jgi:hypothetical protein